jgi:hypothetical protein
VFYRIGNDGSGSQIHKDAANAKKGRQDMIDLEANDYEEPE